jgi:hypothetical protein
MVTLLITSFFVLALIAFAIYFWQKPGSAPEALPLPPPPARGLFIDGTPHGQAKTLAAARADLEADNIAVQRRELVERAKSGDQSTLMAAHNAGEADFYHNVLAFLISGADSDPRLLSLVSYITRHELPVTKELAARFIDSYTRSPDRSSTAKMLHVAALSDDAAIYQNAVHTALMFWRKGCLAEISAEELRTIFDGEFWMLTPSTRSSGEGFLLKRALNSARRELEAA